MNLSLAVEPSAADRCVHGTSMSGRRESEIRRFAIDRTNALRPSSGPMAPVARIGAGGEVIRVFILAGVRMYREGLAQWLASSTSMVVVGTAATPVEALRRLL